MKTVITCDMLFLRYIPLIYRLLNFDQHLSKHTLKWSKILPFKQTEILTIIPIIFTTNL